MTEDLSQKIITQDAVKSVILSALVREAFSCEGENCGKATDDACCADHPVIATTWQGERVTRVIGDISGIAEIATQSIMPLVTDMMKSQNVALSMMERWPEEHIRFGVINPDDTTVMLACADWCYACKLERLREFEALEAELRANPGVRTFVPPRDSGASQSPRGCALWHQSIDHPEHEWFSLPEDRTVWCVGWIND